MGRWEYRKIRIRDLKHDITEKELNSLGSEGWELVGLTSIGRGSGYAFLKRSTS